MSSKYQGVLFLDVDGVLNSRGFLTIVATQRVRFPLDPSAIQKINTLIDLDLKVVLSSTWRFNLECREILQAAGFKLQFHEDWRTILNLQTEDVIAKRGDEIDEWLFRHPEVTHFVILDDDSDMLESQKPRFVKTDFCVGLLEEHLKEIRQKILL